MPLKNCKINKGQARKHISNFEFTQLFIGLGWDHNRQDHNVTVEDYVFNLTPIAQKRGFAVYMCPPNTAGRIPEYTIRRKIESGLTKVAQEHLVIFVDAAKSAQVWQWVKRSGGKVACRENAFYKNQKGEILLQKLQPLAFSLEDEDELDITHVLEAVSSGFDTEHLTRKFYDLFQKHHDKFLKFIEGIPEKNLEPWYVSVLLNRLMFIYFIQKKRFLDGNQNYLADKLHEVEKIGKNKFYSDFLCPLFFEGLAKKESDHSPAGSKLFGKVPYLNGGIFAKNQLEESHGHKIKVPDFVFKDLFTFFDGWQWHLDERPVTTDNEINPDVLGYIFEKYINQKQMGAYYTKEDITGYISRNTIIPFIFDSAQKTCKTAFEPSGPVWGLLKSAPERYFYEAIKKGVNLPLPKDIADGINDFSKRQNWNKPAADGYALPTEIWRETVARRQRYEEIKGKLQNGEILSINDFITYNLNIELFAQDIIENCPFPELLRAFWKAIETVSVLDPTCGSGAFLFAALNILEPLYEACLVKMQGFVNSSESPAKFPDFRLTLENIHKHPSEKYFIYKSIILKNLYGVDIMEEAVEICKLRLFLKLVAQVDDVLRIEPLPDIDFNIRSGNTLVGFSTYEEVQGTISSGFDFEGAADKINKKAQDVARLFQRFRKQQTEYGGNVTIADKNELRLRLKEVDDELNKYLYDQYRINTHEKREYTKWVQSHNPFHWFIEFYGILNNGGFDVVIGNPPYIAKVKIRKEYQLLNYITEHCSDIYANVLERVGKLSKMNGRTGMIIPLSLTFSGDFSDLRGYLFKRYTQNWFSSFARIPAALFSADVRVRNTIHMGHNDEDNPQVFSTVLHRWFESARPHLFANLKYTVINPKPYKSLIPKIGNKAIAAAYERCFSLTKKTVASFFAPTKTNYILYFKKSAYNWLNFCRQMPPCYDEKGHRIPHTQFGTINFFDKATRDLAFLFLNGKIMFLFWAIVADDFHVAEWMFADFPIDFDAIPQKQRELLLSLADELEKAMRENTSYKLNAGKKVGNYNLAKCRDVTDRADLIFSVSLGIQNAWPEAEHMYSEIVKTDFEANEEDD